VPRLRIHGAIPPLSHISSWCELIKHRENLYLLLTLMFKMVSLLTFSPFFIPILHTCCIECASVCSEKRKVKLLKTRVATQILIGTCWTENAYIATFTDDARRDQNMM
jgi:hypothetical protein